MGVRKAATVEELVSRFTHNVARFVVDPTIKAMTVDVRIPPSRDDFDDPQDLADLRDAGEDDFAWRHQPELSARVATLIQAAYPSLPITAGHVSTG